eukprot:TRINITY_DN11468_c0_g1_i2.p2 TRINITY_DN11468_c0_g1~~TRINITY_DN11468_c0_g1_i2.p2  ORF type:complete len:174 (-),score=46.63 TRINITY_DN11468_c0_g1_i2:1263-1784(-)
MQAQNSPVGCNAREERKWISAEQPIEEIVIHVVSSFGLVISDEMVQEISELLVKNWLVNPGCLWRLPPEVSEAAINELPIPLLLKQELVRISRLHQQDDEICWKIEGDGGDQGDVSAEDVGLKDMPPSKTFIMRGTEFKGKEALGSKQTLPLLFKDMTFEMEWNDNFVIESAC